MENPNGRPAIIGAQNEILGYDVQANQKKEIAKIGPETIAISRRTSGGTGLGACLAIALMYRGLKYKIY